MTDYIVLGVIAVLCCLELLLLVVVVILVFTPEPRNWISNPPRNGELARRHRDD